MLEKQMTLEPGKSGETCSIDYNLYYNCFLVIFMPY